MQMPKDFFENSEIFPITPPKTDVKDRHHNQIVEALQGKTKTQFIILSVLARNSSQDGQFYITCPVGIGLGCISKWLGWIPTVAPLHDCTYPPPPLTYFLHIKHLVPKRKIPTYSRVFLEDVPKGCKVSDIRTDIHVHIVLEFCAKNSQ